MRPCQSTQKLKLKPVRTGFWAKSYPIYPLKLNYARAQFFRSKKTGHFWKTSAQFFRSNKVYIVISPQCPHSEKWRKNEIAQQQKFLNSTSFLVSLLSFCTYFSCWITCCKDILTKAICFWVIALKKVLSIRDSIEF